MKNSSRFCSLLKSIDQFGIQVNSEVLKQQTFHTIAGGAASLCLLAVAIALFVMMSGDMINKTNPSALSSSVFTENPARVNISKDSYFFMFGLQYPVSYAQFYDETIYTAKMTQDTNVKDEETQIVTSTSVEIPFERCTIEHVPVELKDWFLRITYFNLSNLLCVASEAENKFFAQGSWDNNFFSQITIYINECQNTTESQNCQSQDAINLALTGGYFTFYSADYIIDMLNYENPGQKQGRDYFIQTSLSMRREVYRYLSTSTVNSDDGWLFSNQKTYQYASYDSVREFFYLYDDSVVTDDPKTLIQMAILKTNYDTIYTRSYKKIQTVLAEVQALLPIAVSFLSIICGPYIRKRFYRSLKLSNCQSSHIHTDTFVTNEFNCY